jgi:hypothetical protein
MLRRLLPLVLLLTSVANPVASADAGDATLTGLVVNALGVPLGDVVVTSADRLTTTGVDGRFLLTGVEPGEVTVTRVGYAHQTIMWDGASDWLTITMAPRVVRAIHVAGWVAGDDGPWADMLDIAATTAVNALMIDLKNENGKIYFSDLDVATADEMGAISEPTAGLSARIEEAHALGLYTIVRIVSFQDPIAAGHHPSWAVLDAATGAPMVRNGQQFLDPHDPDARRYALDLARAACDAGVDEVQFDYVRFPDGGQTTLIFDGPTDATTRQATITAFLAEARADMVSRGCATAADIFGWITNTTSDGGIGQQLEALAATVDVLSPMIYPSHYSTGWYGFTVPNDHPGPVVTRASRDALERLPHSAAVLRPWLQDFWYTPDQVREQIDAIDGLNLGWMLWNILSEFSVSGVPIDSQLEAGEAVPDPVALAKPATGFYDVADVHLFAAEVTWLAEQEITTGCNAPWGDFFCPTRVVTRAQMAAFLTRALGLAVPAVADTFSDDDGSPFEPDIEALAAAGITTGCGGDRYCPSDPVTRGQMASFIVRALDLATGPPNRFVDDDGSPHEASIAGLSAAAITAGCALGPEYFCPSEPVTRAQMAAFLYRALAD